MTRWFYVDTAGDRDGACRALLEVIRPRIATLWLDAWSDLTLSPAAALGQTALFERGERQYGGGRRSGPFGSAISLDAVDERDWALLLSYASWSIHVELESADGNILATLHDCGSSVTAALTEAEADRLPSMLGRRPEPLPVRRTLRQRLSRGS